MQDKNDIILITKFLHHMYGLKKILRYQGMPGWENSKIDRWDSVAEHTYRMALMAVLYHKYIVEKPILERVLKMILVHDIVELIASDYSPISAHGGAGGHAFDNAAYKTKYEREEAAANIIFSTLPAELRDECIELWREYAMTKLSPKDATPEGRYAYALDKLEAEMQIVDWQGGGNGWTKEQTDTSYAYTSQWSQYDESLKLVSEILNTEMKNMEK